MLTIKLIKQSVIFAEGFYLEYDSVSNKDVLWFGDYCVMFLGDRTPREGLYYFFLQRVIEGINKDFLDNEVKNRYIQLDTHIMIIDRMGIPRQDFKAKKVSEETKEKAIKYILGDLKC